MNKFSITLLFLFILMSAFSQEYQAFKPDVEYYFRGRNTGNIQAVKIDSVHINSDTIHLYNYFTLRNSIDTSDKCYNPFGASWIGSEIIIVSNGNQFFFNYHGDTIILYSHASLSDRWKMFRYSNGNYIEAKITSVDIIRFLGITDSVKVITLTKKDQNGNKIESGLNNKQILLSKNYGFIQVLDFYYFPDYQSYDPGFTLYPDTVYHLAGISQLSNGIRNITAHEIFGFNVGDEFHTEYIHTPVGPYTQTKEYLIKKIIDKIVSTNNDTITYSIAICGRREVIDTEGNLKVLIENDTISKKYILSAEDYRGLVYFPDESFYNTEVGHFEYLNMSINKNYNSRLIKSFPPITYVQQSDSCYFMGFTTPSQPYRFYIEGCGGEYYIGNYDKEWGDHYTLVYFKKGTDIWGVPFNCDVLLNKNKLIAIQSFKIFPNPVDRLITVNFENDITLPYNFIMFDIMGRVVKIIKIFSKVTEINVDDLKSGLYFYELQNRNNPARTTGKIVIK